MTVVCSSVAWAIWSFSHLSLNLMKNLLVGNRGNKHMHGNLTNNFPLYIAQSTDKLCKSFTYQGFSEAGVSQTGVCLIQQSVLCQIYTSVIEFISCPTSIVLLWGTSTNQLHIMNLKWWIQAGCKHRIWDFRDAIVTWLIFPSYRKK